MIDHGPPGQVEGGDAAGTSVDERRHAHANSDIVGRHAEIAEPGEDVGMEVDQTGDHEPAAHVDAVGLRILAPSRKVGLDRPDHPVFDGDIGDAVGLGDGVDHPSTGQQQNHRRTLPTVCFVGVSDVLRSFFGPVSGQVTETASMTNTSVSPPLIGPCPASP